MMDGELWNILTMDVNGFDIAKLPKKIKIPVQCIDNILLGKHDRSIENSKCQFFALTKLLS